MHTRGGDRRTALAAAVALAASTGGAGCQLGTQRAGTPFEVRATLVQDTCGPQAVPVLHTVVFHVEFGVERDRGRASWQVMESGASANGDYVASSRGFRFAQDSQELRRDVDRVNGRAACVLRRLDVIDGTLSADLPARSDGGADGALMADAADEASDASEGGAPGSANDAGASDEAGAGGDAASAAPTFSATETVVYGAVAGADCSDQVGASDGQFLALPCQQVFDLRGTMIPPTP